MRLPSVTSALRSGQYHRRLSVMSRWPSAVCMHRKMIVSFAKPHGSWNFSARRGLATTTFAMALSHEKGRVQPGLPLAIAVNSSPMKSEPAG